ncbi:hypothetical protein [Clostridium akagii]|uniref:hypothetical protein n=1 Tax=Clostridium akagii TaxID=91623 RepID=UPI00047A0CE0|nr:hypothetical protein [Clostridium akagii]
MNINKIWQGKTIKQVRGKCENTISHFQSKIQNTYNTKNARITKETKDTIQECKEFQQQSEKKFEDYYKRKKFIDYIVYVDLAISNILLVVLCYFMFIK